MTTTTTPQDHTAMQGDGLSIRQFEVVCHWAAAAARLGAPVIRSPFSYHIGTQGQVAVVRIGRVEFHLTRWRQFEQLRAAIEAHYPDHASYFAVHARAPELAAA